MGEPRPGVLKVGCRCDCRLPLLVLGVKAQAWQAWPDRAGAGQDSLCVWNSPLSAFVFLFCRSVMSVIHPLRGRELWVRHIPYTDTRHGTVLRTSLIAHRSRPHLTGHGAVAEYQSPSVSTIWNPRNHKSVPACMHGSM